MKPRLSTLGVRSSTCDGEPVAVQHVDDHRRRSDHPAFRQGDDAVFDDVVAEYRQELLRHARRRTPDDAAAEDLVQETFVRAYRSFGRLPDDSRVRPWLHQILRNLCIDDAHRRRRELDKVERATAQASRVAVDGPEETLGLDVDTVALTAR